MSLPGEGGSSSPTTHARLVVGVYGDRADLLVVGRRDRSIADDVILGSTSAYCLHHAGCPVVVVSASGQLEQRQVSELAKANRA